MSRKKKDKQVVCTSTDQAKALDTIRENIAEPSCGYPVPVACVILIDRKNAKDTSPTFHVKEFSSFEEAQSKNPDGKWSVCLSFQHGYYSNWYLEFADIIADAFKYSFVSSDVSKIAVMFAAWHDMPDEMLKLRKQSQIPVIVDFNGAFEGADAVYIKVMKRKERNQKHKALLDGTEEPAKMTSSEFFMFLNKVSMGYTEQPDNFVDERS